MNRSPLFYPLNRAGDADGGGAADLQTDIMRFMAILALCLVAIFALVQSIPLTPQNPAAEVAPDTVESMPTVAVERIPEQPTIPTAITPPTPTTRAETTAREKDSESPVSQAPDQAPPSNAPARKTGFTLRFSSDLALTRLVARNEVALYAISPDRTLRMSMNRGEYSFRPATTPNKFHEMDARTVPGEVVAAMRRTNSSGTAAGIKWGVTLPANMRRQLDLYLVEHTDGELVIEPDGKLRLEP